MRLAPGSGPRSRSGMIASSPSGAMAPSRLLRISFRRPRPAPAAPSFIAATASARSSSLERIGLRSLTISSSGIRVLAQWMAPTPMQEQRDPEAEPEQLGREADLLEHLVALGAGRLDREVRDDEQQRAQGREAEEGGHLALAALRGLGVDVRAPVDVRRQAGVAVAGRQLAAVAVGGRDVGACLRVLGPQVRVGESLAASAVPCTLPLPLLCRLDAVLVLRHRAFAPSQTAQAMSAPMPTSQPTAPSDTGPILPRARPPGDGSAEWS